MAINDLTGLSSVHAGARSKASSHSPGAGTAASGQQPATNAPNPAETVKFSSEAQMLNKLEEQLSELPDTNEGRIASIKQAIADGTFSINPERIATKLASLEEQLFN